MNCSFNKAPKIFKCMWTSIAYNYELTILALCSAGASGLHLTKHENFHGGLDAISVGDGLFTILTTLSKRATSVQVMLQPILTYMACGYMGRQVSFILRFDDLNKYRAVLTHIYLFIYFSPPCHCTFFRDRSQPVNCQSLFCGSYFECWTPVRLLRPSMTWVGVYT